jgi:hypothetical protein
MKALLLASVAAAFMSETCETVTVGGVRVNKSDYEADQQKPAGERQYKGKVTEAEPSTVNTAGVMDTSDGPPLAAPSAPHFGGEDAAAPAAPIDPLKGAVAPTTGTADQRLVLKDGSKYFVVDAHGKKIEGDGIEKGGYKTEDAAWKAIKDLPH